MRITIDPAVRFGKPCVRGTRLTVGDVLGTLASGCSEAELLEDFPRLSTRAVCLAIGNVSHAVTVDGLLCNAKEIEWFVSHPEAGFLLL